MNEQEPYQEDNFGYMPRFEQNTNDPLLNQHLKAGDILKQLEKMLKGQEFSEEKQDWIPSMITIRQKSENGTIIEQQMEEGPLMDPKDIRVVISYLQMFLNSNTFLGRVDDARVNDIMWDISKKLGALFYRLRHKISPETRDLVWGMIEYPILMGLSRASNKITLDAISKMQHSVEHINPNQQSQGQQDNKKEFKILGW